jgi:hypothetical protein
VVQQARPDSNIDNEELHVTQWLKEAKREYRRSYRAKKKAAHEVSHGCFQPKQ